MAARSFRDAIDETAAVAAACKGTTTQFLGGFYGIAGVPAVLQVTPDGPRPYEVHLTAEPLVATAPEHIRAFAFRAVVDGDLESLKLLVANYPSLLTEPLSTLKQSVLHCAAFYRSSGPILTWLLQQPQLDLMARSVTGKLPLQYAISGINISAIVALLVTPNNGLDKLVAADFPPYFEGQNLTTSVILDIFRMIELLPTTHKLWDKRWILFYQQERPGLLAKRPAPDPTLPDSPDMCVICMATAPTTIVIPCMHKVVCSACSVKLQTDEHNSHICVVCRQPIDSIYNQTTAVLAAPGQPASPK
jgi:hypothetical protein